MRGGAWPVLPFPHWPGAAHGGRHAAILAHFRRQSSSGELLH